MRTVIISTDKSAFYEASDTRRRFEVYARVLGEAHFIVVGRGSHKTVVIEKGTIASAHGKWRIVALLRAYRIGSRVENIEIVSAQDPFEQGFVGWLIAKRLKAKLHLQIHTDIGSPYFAEGIKNKIRARIARFLNGLKQRRFVNLEPRLIAFLFYQYGEQKSMSDVPLGMDGKVRFRNMIPLFW